jgi:hypothetical protein
MPNDRDIDDFDQADDNDISPAGLERRLTKIGRVLTRINARLDAITANMAEPPDPSKPPIRAAINNITAQAQSTQGKAAVILNKVNGLPTSDGPP